MAKLEMTRLPALEYACQEAINSLCTNLSFFDAEKRVFMITSTKPHEGKSFISMNIAMTMASLGNRVVLVDADLRRSQVVTSYGIRSMGGKGYGITHYLAGKCKLGDALYETNLPGLFMMPVGRAVSNSLALLKTKCFHETLEKLKETVEFVIVDAPPIGAIIDAAEIAKSCDGAILVIRYNEVSRQEALESKLQIERAGCAVLGAVLNAVDFGSISSKKYYNKSYYTYYTNGYYKPGARMRRRESRAGKEE